MALTKGDLSRIKELLKPIADKAERCVSTLFGIAGNNGFASKLARLEERIENAGSVPQKLQSAGIVVLLIDFASRRSVDIIHFFQSSGGAGFAWLFDLFSKLSFS